MSNWIPISERMPTREDADELGNVLWTWGDGLADVGAFDGLDKTFVAWMPIPPYTPPKPGPTDEELGALFNQLARAHGTPYPRHIARDWFAAVTARIEREKGK